MNNQPIGIFDSGVGGLSVLKEVKKLLSKENYIFLADQKHVPYGGKTKNELEKLTDKILSFFVSKNVKAVIIACNIATVYTIDHLRKKYSFPIIGTVPAIKTIADITKTKKVAVFSTPATAKSIYLSSLIKKFAKDTIIYKIGGSKLEDLVELGDLKNPEIEKVLKECLTPLRKKNVDAIALGCTHYPFLRDKIAEIMGKDVKIVDSGGAVARRTKEVLKNEKLSGNIRSKDSFYTTGDKKKFKKALKNLLDLDTDRVYNLKL